MTGASSAPSPRVLVVRMSSIGDIVLTEPVVAAIAEAHPDARVGYAVKARYADLVRFHPAIAVVHELADSSPAALMRLCREVRAERYTTAVDLHGNARSVALVRCSGAEVTSRYRKRELSTALRVRVGRRPFRATRLLVDRYLEAIAPLGIGVAGRRPVLHLSSEARERAASLLGGFGLEPGAFVAMVPGTVWPTKRWPPERYAELAVRLSRENGAPTLLLGSADEETLCGYVAARAQGAAVSGAGKATLGETAALIELASAYVGNDSGPTHMSMAVGTPTVAIFGPTDPRQFDFEGHALVYADPSCGACSFFGGERCPRGHWECMLSLGVDDVLTALRELPRRSGVRP